jgi:hypothetical protein
MVRLTAQGSQLLDCGNRMFKILIAKPLSFAFNKSAKAKVRLALSTAEHNQFQNTATDGLTRNVGVKPAKLTETLEPYECPRSPGF